MAKHTCWQCDGSGVVRVWDGIKGPPISIDPCPECNGIGETEECQCMARCICECGCGGISGEECKCDGEEDTWEQ